MKRKLALAKETIRSLTTGQLRDVVGGTTATWPRCDTYDYTECEKCSNYCSMPSDCPGCITVDVPCPDTQCFCLSAGDSTCISEMTC